MKNILIAIAKALAAIPRYTLICCARTGDFLLSMIPSPQPVITAAGAEAEEALEIAQAREEGEMFKPKRSDIVLRYAAAVVSGSTPPDLDGEFDALVYWLEDLEPSACRRILQADMRRIERHLNPKSAADHLAGVPSWGGERPERAAPVGHGSKRENAAAVAMVDGIFADLLSDAEERYA